MYISVMDKKDYKLTVRLSQEEIKNIKIFVLENDTTVQDFLKHSINHCMQKKILPEK